MNKKNLQLFAAILSLLVFIGFMSETDSKHLFGYEVSIWVYRLAWLILTITFFKRSLELKKSEDNHSTD